MQEFLVKVNNLDNPQEDIPKLLSLISQAGSWAVFVDYYHLQDENDAIGVIFNPVIIEDGRRLTEEETSDLMVEIVSVLADGCTDLFNYDVTLVVTIDDQEHVFFALGRTGIVMHAIEGNLSDEADDQIENDS